MRERVRETAIFAAAACVVAGWLFRDAVLKGYVLGQGELLLQFLPWAGHRPVGWRPANQLLFDVTTVFYPFLAHAREAVRSGQLPLWSAAVGAGEPFLASFQSAIFSPFTLIVYLLPYPAGLVPAAIARLVLGGAGMYLFLRRLGLRPAAAALGGSAFLLNAFSIVWLEHPMAAVASWTPWLLIAVSGVAERCDRVSVAAVALVTSAMLLSGHPETAFKILMLAGTFTVFVAARHRRLVRATLLVLAGMTLGALISAVQLVPFVEYTQLSRVFEARMAASGPLFTNPPSSLVTAFVPNFYGSPLRHRYVLQTTNYFEQQAYAALVVWILAAASLAHRRLRGHAALFTAAAVGAALIMYGTWAARVAILALPPLKVAALSRFGFITITSAIVLAAIGLDELLERAAGRRVWIVATLCTIAALGIGAVVGGFLVQQRGLLESTRQWPVTLSALEVPAFIVMATVALAWLARALGATVAGLLAIGLVTVELLTFATGLHPLGPKERSFPRTPEIDLVRQDRGVFRVAGWNDALLPNTAMVYGLQDFRSYDGIGVGAYSRLLDVAFRFNGSTHQVVNVAAPHLLDLLNVKYLMTPPDVELPAPRFARLADGPTRVYQNLAVQPRAFLADEFLVADESVALKTLRDGAVDLRRVVLLQAPPPREAWPDTVARGEAEPLQSPGDVAIVKYENERVELTTTAKGRRLLVLSDIYYPGWKATVDGNPAPILVANHAFRAVAVPQGRHTVQFSYQPASFTSGLALSGMGVLVVGALLWNSAAGRVRRSSDEVDAAQPSLS